MILKIAKKEFLLNLLTFKFAVGTIVCVVLTGVFVPALVNEYDQRLKAYSENVADNEAKLHEVIVYGNLTPTVYQRPALSSVFCEGLSKQMNNSARIAVGNVPVVSPATSSVNPFLCIFPTMDLSLVFKVVISLLAMLVAHDVISGERERGTLRLTLSNSTARHRILLGKLLAGLLTLVVPVTVTFIVTLLILGLFPMVDMSVSDWARFGLLYIASLVFISAIYNISLLFSCLTKSSAVSVVIGLFSWVIFVIVIPNGSVYLARRIRTLEPKRKKDAQFAAIGAAFNREWREARKRLPQGASMMESNYSSPFGGRYLLLCTMSGAEYRQQRNTLRIPLLIKYADKAWEVQRTYYSDLVKQGELVNNVSRISPVCLYENVVSTLAGTDLGGIQSFMDRVRAHKERIIEYIRVRTDGFSSTSYFTRSTPEDRIQYEKCANAQDWDTLIQLREKVIGATAPLDLPDFPRFVRSSGLGETLRRAIPDLALLVIMNIILFTLSFVAFQRYDVR